MQELRARAHKAENALKAAEDAKRRADSLLDDANSRAGRAISDAKKFETENKVGILKGLDTHKLTLVLWRSWILISWP